MMVSVKYVHVEETLECVCVVPLLPDDGTAAAPAPVGRWGEAILCHGTLATAIVAVVAGQGGKGIDDLR